MRWEGSLCGGLVVLHLRSLIPGQFDYRPDSPPWRLFHKEMNYDYVTNILQWMFLLIFASIAPFLFLSLCSCTLCSVLPRTNSPQWLFKIFFGNAEDILPKKEKGHQFLLTGMNKTSNCFMKLAWEKASPKAKNVYMETKS